MPRLAPKPLKLENDEEQELKKILLVTVQVNKLPRERKLSSQPLKAKIIVKSQENWE